MQSNLSALDMEYQWIIPVFIGVAMLTLAFMFLKYVVLSSKNDEDDDEK